MKFLRSILLATVFLSSSLAMAMNPPRGPVERCDTAQKNPCPKDMECIIVMGHGYCIATDPNLVDFLQTGELETEVQSTDDYQ